MVAGYITKKLSERSKCSKYHLKLATSKSRIDHDDYLQQLSRGGLITPSISLRDFIFRTFSISTLTIKTITKDVYVRSISERVLPNLGYSTNSICDLHSVLG